MQARLVELNEEWKAEAEAEGRRHIPVNIGIGLNTGQASVGNFGSTQRFTYSCLGDDVNLASRLEGQCKTYSVGIIIGDKTRQQVPDYRRARARPGHGQGQDRTRTLSMR